MSGTLSGVLGRLNPTAVTGIQQALGLAAGPLAALNFPLTAVFRMGRSIAAIVPDVTIDEHHSDRLEITTHPVSDNTPISDHAFMQPASVTMRCGWTNANPLAGITESVGGVLGSVFSGGFVPPSFSGGMGTIGNPFNSATETRARDVYNRLLALQKTREPFVLSTGKRRYPSMLITDISVTTDRHSEYSLMCEVHMQEVVRVAFKSVQGTAQGQGVSGAPQTTNPTGQTGPTQPTRGPSGLQQLIGDTGIKIMQPSTWFGGK
jgi:Dit-like phage tail protein